MLHTTAPHYDPVKQGVHVWWSRRAAAASSVLCIRLLAPACLLPACLTLLPLLPSVHYLDFKGRVTKVSVKNFQLVGWDHNSNSLGTELVMLFGKQSGEYALDFSYPLNGLQALGLGERAPVWAGCAPACMRGIAWGCMHAVRVCASMTAC